MQFAAGLGVQLLTPHTHEIEREGYRQNAGDRCYFCKAELVEVLTPLAAELGSGRGRDRDQRRRCPGRLPSRDPGRRRARCGDAAARVPGSPRPRSGRASRAWGLPTWDKPAAACLSSRIAYGLEVTPMRLARVERAEVALRTVAGSARCSTCTDLRVRDLGRRARIEIDPAPSRPGAR